MTGGREGGVSCQQQLPHVSDVIEYPVDILLLHVYLCRLMGEHSEAVPREFEGEVGSIASRLATPDLLQSLTAYTFLLCSYVCV
jgi:hypothetical protein